MVVGTHGRLPTRRRMVWRWVHTDSCRCSRQTHVVGKNQQVVLCKCNAPFFFTLTFTQRTLDNQSCICSTYEVLSCIFFELNFSQPKSKPLRTQNRGACFFWAVYSQMAERPELGFSATDLLNPWELRHAACESFKKLIKYKGAFIYDVRCFSGIFDLPTHIRYFTT